VTAAATAMPAAGPSPAPRAATPRRLLFAVLLTLPLVTPRIRGADEIEYFAYLRSAVFDRDLEFGNEYARFYDADPQGLAGFKATFLDLREPATGRHINFAPLGTALLWSPAYLGAHAAVLTARALGASVAADGFSRPYVIAVCYASWLYGAAALLLLHRLLVRLGGFEDPSASGAVAAVLWATPVLYYLTLGPGFSHAASLFVITALLWLTLRFRREGFTPGRAAGVGALGGLAALVREQDGLFLAVPVLVIALDGLRARRLAPALGQLAAVAAAAAAVFAPQLLAYRAVNGSFGPSRLVARKMSYASPHALAVLFDPGHGAFVWAPLLLLATAGLVLAAARSRKGDSVPIALLAALALQVWINGSVESWSQAGAFGSRRFVAATPLFAWGLAALLAAARPRVDRRWLAAGLLLLAWWNVSLIVQFGLRIMDRQRLEWPRVAVRQVTEVPRRLARAGWLFFTDRERLVRESR
jgi:hypothetical protein